MYANKTKIFKFKGLNLIIVNLGRCDIIYNTIGNPDAPACVPNKVEIINVKLFNMITDINEVKTLIKHISCDSRCKMDGGNVILRKNRIIISSDPSVKNH